MVKQGFLVVPSKTTYELDLGSRVASYIQTCLSLAPETQSSVKEGLDELNRQRRNALLHDECGKSMSSIEAICKYYDNFSALADKIQIRDGECPIPFRWKSAFGEKSLFAGKRDLTINQSGYEKACVLFNIAAFQSKYAASLELNSDDDLRSAVRCYQLSANIFDMLKNEIMSLVPDEVLRDMQPQLLNALAQLMITQANEVMYVKALKDSSAAILRSIAMQLADNYNSVFKLLNFEQARGIVDKSWYTVIQAKAYAFQAYGSKHQFDYLESDGLNSLEERLARAQEVLELFEKADQIHSRAYENEIKMAKTAWEKIEKDNNLIYHARIPKKTELPAIPRKLVLNIGAVKFPLSKDFKDIFVQLVSVHVSKAANLFQGKLKERVFAFVNDLRTSNTKVKSGLAAINMPALIEDELKHEHIPASIISKSEEIRSKGGFHALEVQEKSLAQACSQANELLTKIRTTLDAEECSDTVLRANYGAQWTTMSSSKLTEKFKQEIGKYLGITRNAMEADEKVKRKILLCEQDVVVMSGPQEDLAKRIPPIKVNANQKSQAVEKLRELWGVMNNEMQKAERLEKQLNEFNYDPTSEFLETLKKDGSLDDAKAASFSASKLDSILGGLAKEVTENKNLRTNVLEEMQVWHQQFNSGAEVDQPRTKALQQLAAAYDTYLECQSNLKEGTKFYSDLKLLLIRLQQQIDDFCFARQTEKEDIVTVLESGKNAAETIKSLVEKSKSTSASAPPSASSVPPPRPPPPASNTTAISKISDAFKSLMTRAPEAVDQANPPSSQQASTAPPAVPPRIDNAPPTIPQHQQTQGYQPNNMPQNNWYQYQQPYQNYQQPYLQQGYQQMPNLPYYGAMQSGPGGYPLQNVANVPTAPYPNQQYPPNYPQPQFGYPIAQPNPQPPPSNNYNPFAQ